MDWFIGIATLLVLGLIVGAIAKFLMPGDDPGGIVVTCILGILGAILGGWLASLVGIGGITGFDWRTLVTAVAGSLLLLLGYRAIRMLAPAASGPSYSAGRSTGRAPLRAQGLMGDDFHHETDLADIAESAVTPEVVRTLSEKTGEGQSQIRKAMDALIPTVLASISHHASTSSVASQLFDMAKGAAQGGMDRRVAEGDVEAVAKHSQGFLHMLFGDKLGGLLGWLARFAGIKDSSASTLMNAASGLVMSTLGKTIQQKGLDASTFGRLLSSQAGSLSRLLPAGIGDVPGMRSLAELGDRAAIAGRAGADAARRAGADVARRAGVAAQGAYRETVGAVSDGTRWLSALAPLVLLLLALPLFAWLVKGAGEKIEQAKADAARVPAQAAPGPEVVQTTKPEGEIVRAGTNTPVVPTSVELRDITLPGGATLKLPRTSFLNSVYSYLTDATAPKNRAFVFDGLDFDNATNRIRPDSETAIADLTTLLRAFPASTLRIEGHTDPSSDPAADRRVSLARAESLRDLLVKVGVPTERVTAEGFGCDKPVADNNTAEGRAKNRRIELSLTRSP
jgi:outer membrane protein OmpA-like peptidoglycan-associated protein/uncharacterized membrane protein YeaQ/YmgE (transglycosylase-associated protein family)